MGLAPIGPQHFRPGAQCPLPQATPDAPKALPKPKEVNTAPPTAPVTSPNAFLRETGLAIIRDTLSKSVLISLLLLTPRSFTGEGQYSVFSHCHVLSNYAVFPD
jgi:hypothetical protein